jgi:hypothetical protein
LRSQIPTRRRRPASSAWRAASYNGNASARIGAISLHLARPVTVWPKACRFKLVSFPEADDLLFVDEYHYRAESQSLIAERLAEQMT